MISTKKKDKKKKKHRNTDDDFDFDLPPADSSNTLINIERDSEEWRRFQELTDRAKNVVDQSQSSLSHLAETSVSDYVGNFRYDVVKADIERAAVIKDKHWVNFEDQTGLEKPVASLASAIPSENIIEGLVNTTTSSHPNGLDNKSSSHSEDLLGLSFDSDPAPATGTVDSDIKATSSTYSKKPPRPPPPRRQSTQEAERSNGGSPPFPVVTESNTTEVKSVDMDELLDFGFGSGPSVTMPLPVAPGVEKKPSGLDSDLFDIGSFGMMPKPPPPSPQHVFDSAASKVELPDFKEHAPSKPVFTAGGDFNFFELDSSNPVVSDSTSIEEPSVITSTGKSAFRDIFGGPELSDFPPQEIVGAFSEEPFDPFSRVDTSSPPPAALDPPVLLKETLDITHDASDGDSALSHEEVDGCLKAGVYEPLGADTSDFEQAQDEDVFGLKMTQEKPDNPTTSADEAFGSDLFTNLESAEKPAAAVPEIDDWFTAMESKPAAKPIDKARDLFSDDLFASSDMAADISHKATNENDPFVVPTSIRSVASGDPFASDDMFSAEVDPFAALESSAPFLSNDPFTAPQQHQTDETVAFSSDIEDNFDFSAFSEQKQAPTSNAKTHQKSVDEPQSPLYEEDTSEPLTDFCETWDGEGWEMYLRMPNKKKMTGQRFWQKVYVKVVKENVLQLFNNAEDKDPFQELPLQACYSLSPLVLQQYDEFTKLHTFKLQYVFYKERVGIHGIQGTIQSSFYAIQEMIRPKHALPLEHAPQSSALMKLGSLNYRDAQMFVMVIEDAMFKLNAHRERSLTYKQDEITMTVIDEFKCHVDKNVVATQQTARVRIFCLAFLTGMPECEVGVNDRRKEGKEVVGRKDIIPCKTEEWIRLENCEFHCVVDLDEFEKSQVIKYKPLDACQFELMRFRVRPPRNRELPLQPKVIWRMKGVKVEIRCEIMVPGYHSRKHGQVACEDIQLRIPIPEDWIYLFRVEKRFRYGSKHSAHRKPGKIKGIERVLGAAQTLEQQLIEASTGIAKYEHVFRSLVWRIPKLPERHHGEY